LNLFLEVFRHLIDLNSTYLSFFTLLKLNRLLFDPYKYSFLCNDGLKEHDKRLAVQQKDSVPKDTECFTHLEKLNLIMAVRFSAGANFRHCPSCLKKLNSLPKWSKSTQNKRHANNDLNP
jgi:hypothetical protein